MSFINRKPLLIIIIFLTLIECGSLFMMYKSYSNKIAQTTDVYKENIIQSNRFAIMIEQANQEYVKSNLDMFPSKGYKVNIEKSACYDMDDNKISDMISFDSDARKVVIKSSVASSCYLYFDIHNIYDMCKDYDSMSSCMESTNNEINLIFNVSNDQLGNLYRYQGSAEDVTNNYVCFGTQDLSTCVNNPDYYMYRIIGVTSDGYIKLIKKTPLNTTPYYWDNNATEVITWPDSDLFLGLNGLDGGEYANIFVNSSNFSYMKINEVWYNKIRMHAWKYGEIADTKLYVSGNEMLTFENEFTSEVEAKIGLMNISDYYLAAYSDVYNYSDFFNSWIHVSKNVDTNVYEWTMIRKVWPENYDYNIVWRVSVNGYIAGDTPNVPDRYARPVFYLQNAIKVISGDGTINNPYLID